MDRIPPPAPAPGPSPRGFLHALIRPALVVLALLLLLMVSPAQAQTYSMDYTLPSSDSAALSAFQIHTTNLDSYFGSGGVAVNACYFNASWGSTPAPGYASSFKVYCVDLNHYDANPSTVTTHAVPTYGMPTGGGQYTQTAYQQAAWLYDNYGSATGLDSSALQLAIWSVLDSTFSVSAGNSAAISQSQTWAMNARQNSTSLNSRATVFAAINHTQTNVAFQPNEAGQDMLGPGSEAPEPTSLVLVLIGGLGCLGLFRRRPMGTS